MKWKSISLANTIKPTPQSYITITKHKPNKMVALYGYANPIARLFEVAGSSASTVLNALCVDAGLYRTCNGVDFSHVWNVCHNQKCSICGRPFDDIPPGQ